MESEMVKDILKKTLLFSLIVFGLGGLTWAATIEGTVYDPGGQVVSGARVSLTRSLSIIGERQTDSRGVYRFEGLQEGKYQIAASSHGLAGPLIDVELPTAEGKKQDIHLEISAIESRVVVSASLGGILAPQIGSSVSLIDGQEINDRGAQNIFEAIRGASGTEVSQSGRRGGVTGVYVRGGESKYNTVMMDGIPLNEFGGSFDMASLPADGIERVEVIRGPQSALYGPNTVTSAINLVSNRGEGPPRFSARAEGGSNATRLFATGGSGLNGGLSWSYNLSRLVSDGVVENDNYRNQSAFLSLGFGQSSRRQFGFDFFGNANDAGSPGPYGSDPDNLFAGIDTVSRNKQNLFGYQVNYSEQFASRVRQVTTFSFSTNDYNFLSPYGSSFSDNLRGVANTRSEINISNADSLAVGFEYNREQMKNSFITDGTFYSFLLPRTSLAYFVENRWSPSSRLYLIAGVRLDNLRTHSLPPGAFGSRPFIPATSVVKANPRLSLSYVARADSSGGSFGMTRLHGSFGTGIRPPTGFELAFTDNPELKPERSISFDGGVEQKILSSRAVLDLTYYYNRFQDQIVVLGGSLTNLSSFTSANVANSKAQGLEASFRVRPLQSLELSGQYTFLDSSILALDGTSRANAPFQVGQRLIRRPTHSASCNVTWHHGKLMLNTNAYIRGTTLDIEPNLGTFACTLGLPCFFENSGYVRADGGFSYQLPRGVEIYGRLNNFLNQKYEEVYGYPSLHLNFMAGMRFRFPSE
jgi:outer membrane receptor protein involved in Fe transport